MKIVCKDTSTFMENDELKNLREKINILDDKILELLKDRADIVSEIGKHKNSLEKVAETLSMSYVRVLEVATFYSMFNLQPIGENFVQICRTTPCWLRGSDKLLDVAREVTEINIGETSADNKFTIVEVECLGACCNAPMVQINDDYYEDLDSENFKNLLINLKNNKSVKKGSQISRQNSHPLRKL